MPANYRLSTEFFAIPYHGDAYILYSPLKQVLMLANQDMVDLVAALKEGSFTGVNGDNMDAMQLLLESGAVNGPDDTPPKHRVASEWKPTEVTLFLTNACNLRCVYCYASAGEYKGSMDEVTALAAVDLIVKNALELGRPEIRVSYHGGGEPTLEWNTLVASATRAEELAARHGLKLSLNLATNGVLPAWKVDWLVRHVHEYSISYDGPGKLQDRQRPTVTGRGSAETVEATFRHLDSHGARYGIRMTVSQETVDTLADTTAYLLDRFNPSVIHIEPLFSHGRARDKGLMAPDAAAFIANYRKAQTIADQYQVELYYSGARIDTLTDVFCGVPDGSFNVTPEGLLTSCFEVCHPEDEHADEFFYGGRDRTGTGFDVSQTKLQRMADHTVRERHECEGCFCKWHCAGDCIAKNLTSDEHAGEGLKAARCIINQELSRDQLIRKLKENSRVMNVVDATIPWEAEELTPLYDADAVQREEYRPPPPLEPAPALIQLGLPRAATPLATSGGCHA